MPASVSENLSAKITKSLHESEISNELKWNEVRNARNRFAAIKILEILLEYAANKQLRIDVLIWDTQDFRHKVMGRNDVANLQNMYIQLFKNVLVRRWAADSTWQLFPDENSAIDWKKVKNILEMRRISSLHSDILAPESSFIQSDFHLLEIEEVSSHQTPLSQAADLAVGIGVFSYDNYLVYKAWSVKEAGQLTMDFLNTQQSFSSRENEQCLVLEQYLKTAIKFNLGVSLNSSQGLNTKDPGNPVNYWFYRSVRVDDKAPIKSGRHK